MTIPTDTDSHHRRHLAVVEDQPIEAATLTDEELRQLAENPLVHVAFDLTAGSPYDPARFDSFRDFLPARGHVVYHLVDRWGAVLYVGQTGQPRNRLRAHWSTKPWIREVCTVRLFQTVDALSARHLERAHTGQYSPRYSQVTRAERIMLDRLLAAEESAWNEDDL